MEKLIIKCGINTNKAIHMLEQYMIKNIIKYTIFSIIALQLL